MGQDIYTSYWKDLLYKIRDVFASGRMTWETDVRDLADVGDRSSYAGTVVFRFGQAATHTDAAPYRDLLQAIKASSFIKPYLNNEFSIKVTGSLKLIASFKQIHVPDLIAAYKKLALPNNANEIYKWNTLGKQHFDLDAHDFHTMIKAIDFHNLTFYNARGVLYILAKNYPEELRSAFKNLFNEDVSLTERVVTFRSKADEMYRRTEPVLASHQDERSIATYLTYFKPEKYSFYKDGFYTKYCKLLGVKTESINQKYVHYLSLVQELIQRYIQPDEDLKRQVKNFIPADSFQDPNFTLLAQDILYQTLEGTWEEGEDLPPNSTIERSSLLKTNLSLNQILYGPPGTGKTYTTVDTAVSIANPTFVLEGKGREEIKEEYDRLKSDGQIEFITFHQSMSYEDFIEGIKPKRPELNDTFVKYEIEEGIFKRLAKRAGSQPKHQARTFSITPAEFESAIFYKISLGNTAIPDDEQLYRYCIDNGYIALGWGGANDFSGKSEHDISQMVPAVLEKFEARAVNYFIHYLKVGDYVVVSNGNLLFRAIGIVSGDYEHKQIEGSEMSQFRKVNWLLRDVDIPVEELYNKQFSQQTIYRLSKTDIKESFFIKKLNTSDRVDHEVKNYVSIIDEINRGNVSSIFGELITLIEEDKRQGNKETIEVVLPYSKEKFSVPNNLFIIGTMNTADKSVEALDTALRRRFMFKEMLPDPTQLKKIENLDVDLKFLLTTVNARLSVLLSKDHTIGHAWLMGLTNLTDLQLVFKNKILPLLQEYFYNNYAKIGLVLGQRFFDDPIRVDKRLFAKFKWAEELTDDYGERIVYNLKDPFTLTEEDFRSIYETTNP